MGHEQVFLKKRGFIFSKREFTVIYRELFFDIFNRNIRNRKVLFKKDAIPLDCSNYKKGTDYLKM